jgi:hypothetical protein
MLHGFMASLLIVLRRRLEDIASGGYGDYSVISFNHELTTIDADIPTLPPYDLRDQASHALLVKDRQALLASTFRGLMTSDLSFRGHNDYRQRFYEEVVDLANEVNYLILHSFLFRG